MNKNAKEFVKNKDADKDDEGGKWSLRALKQHLQEERGIDTTGAGTWYWYLVLVLTGTGVYMYTE